MGVPADESRGALRFAILAALVAAAAVAGYLGYVLYPRFDLPRTVGAGTVALAAAAGAASFFSPCSFPLLVTLLGRSTQAEPRRAVRLRRAAVFAGAMSLGATVFVLGAGALIAFGGRGVAASVTFTSTAGRAIRGVVGATLILLGLVQLGVVRVPFHVVSRIAHPLSSGHARLRREHPVAGFALFGFTYLLAGFG